MSVMIKAIYAKNKLRNYQYLLISEKTVCIDPFDGEQVISTLGSNEQIKVLINTHQHYDHIKGNQHILDQGAILLDRSYKEISLNDQDKLCRIHTPGHTQDSDSLLLYENNVLKAVFGGDTLFVGGVGNCYNGGDPPTLAQTLIVFDTILQNETIIYPGHDYWEANSEFSLSHFGDYLSLKEAISIRDKNRIETTWGEEKQHNPFLRVLFDKNFRTQYFPQASKVEAFCEIRKRRDNF